MGWKQTREIVEIKHKLSSELYDDVHEFPYIVYQTVPLEAVLPAPYKIKRSSYLIKRIPHGK
jgi:hypothetical protein